MVSYRSLPPHSLSLSHLALGRDSRQVVCLLLMTSQLSVLCVKITHDLVYPSFETVSSRYFTHVCGGYSAFCPTPCWLNPHLAHEFKRSRTPVVFKVDIPPPLSHPPSHPHDRLQRHNSKKSSSSLVL